MTANEDLDVRLALLPGWQAGLFVAGCAQRIAPVVELWGAPKTVTMHREVMGEVWRARGELDEAEADRLQALIEAAEEADEDDSNSASFQVMTALGQLVYAIDAGRPEPTYLPAGAFAAGRARELYGSFDWLASHDPGDAGRQRVRCCPPSSSPSTTLRRCWRPNAKPSAEPRSPESWRIGYGNCRSSGPPCSNERCRRSPAATGGPTTADPNAGACHGTGSTPRTSAWTRQTGPRSVPEPCGRARRVPRRPCRGWSLVVAPSRAGSPPPGRLCWRRSRGRL
jgi:hypothetical protein